MMRVFVHYLLAVAVLTLYGSQVTQSIADLPAEIPVVTFLSAYAISFLLRRVLERRIVTSKSMTLHAKRQFLLDSALGLSTGLVVALSAPLILKVSVAGALSLYFAIAVCGFFIALDTSLSRERAVILSAPENDTPPPASRLNRSMTRSFGLVGILGIVSVTVTIVLVISMDMAWLTKVEPDPNSIMEAVLNITMEIILVMVFLLGHGINLILSYSRNLKLLFRSETRVLEKVSRGDLNHLVPVVTHDEFGQIAVHTNQMIEGLRHRTQLVAAMKMAEEVQRNLLPNEFPVLPGIDLSGTCFYCDQIGGDYYDYLLLPKGRIGMVVADTCGHGIDAALFMATARAFLKKGAKGYQSPAQVINDVNQDLCKDSGNSGRFITMFFLEINVPMRSLKWARAGHDPAIVFDPVKKAFHELDGDGAALGVDHCLLFRDFQQDLYKPGSVVIIGTDGLWEARSPSGEMFGKSRLKDVVARSSMKSAAHIQADVISAVQQFIGENSPEDDVALMVAKLL